MQEIDFFTIDVEPVAWRQAESTLRQLRCRLSSAEKQENAAGSVDTTDAEAWHWIAYDANQTPMGSVRLQGDGKIDRLVVLPEFRDKGVGGSLLRKAVSFGIDQAFPRIYLHAPKKLLAFFQKMKFVATGDDLQILSSPYEEMTLDLQRYRKPPARPLPEISESDRHRKMLEGLENLNAASVELLQKAQRQVRIFSQKLYPDIYAGKAFCDAMLEVCTRHAFVEVKILVDDKQDYLHHNHHPLVDLHRQLTSSIQMRRLAANARAEQTEYLLIDDMGHLYLQEPAHHIGYVHPYARHETAVLMQEFDNLWEISAPDPNIRQMRL